MSDLENEKAKQQATRDVVAQRAKESLSVPNPAHSAAEQDVMNCDVNLDLIAREQEVGSVPPRSRAKVLKPQWSNNPGVIVTGEPPARGIPANATLNSDGYYTTPDGKVIKA